MGRKDTIVLKRRMVYESRLFDLDQDLHNKKITREQYDIIHDRYKAIMDELILIQSLMTNKITD